MHFNSSYYLTRLFNTSCSFINPSTFINPLSPLLLSRFIILEEPLRLYFVVPAFSVQPKFLYFSIVGSKNSCYPKVRIRNHHNHNAR
jgi:hypothetical protein